MADFFEVDFLTAGESQSGDAISLRYERDGNTFVHVVDGGFQDDGPNVLDHLRKYYGGTAVSHVVLTHPDGDHAGGLRTVLEECSVASGGGLWMLRPWLYADERKGEVTDEVLERGVLEGQYTPRGKTRRLLLRITSAAATALGLPQEVKRKESLAHEHWKRWYAARFEALGYDVELEASRNTGRVDVLARRGAESVAIEVETGESDVVRNVTQDLLSRFTRIVVVATDHRVLRKVETQLAKADLLLVRVEIILRGEDSATERSWKGAAS